MCAQATKRGGEPGGGPLDGTIQIHFPYFGTWNPSYPADTVYRVRGTIPGFEPVAAGGQFIEPSIKSDGDDFVIEAKAGEVPMIEGGSGGPSTIRCTTGRRVTWGGILAPASRGWAKGFTWSSNGHTVAMPQVRRIPADAPPQLYFDVTGCGDGDPATLDGFLASFLPPGFIKELGISEEQLESSDESSLANLFSVSDNGTSASPRFTKVTAPDGQKGVRLDYGLSFSRHEITVQAKGIPPAKPTVKWSSNRKTRTIRATISVPATGTTTHTIAAAKSGGKRTKRGKCVTAAKGRLAVCTITLTKGAWRVSVTPMLGAMAGTANSKTFRF